MKRYILGFKDDVAGIFDYFGVFNNIELGKRAFVNACREPNVPAVDLSLYCIATFDTATGCISNVDDELGNFPEYIMRGEKEE